MNWLPVLPTLVELDRVEWEELNTKELVKIHSTTYLNLTWEDFITKMRLRYLDNYRGKAYE